MDRYVSGLLSFTSVAQDGHIETSCGNKLRDLNQQDFFNNALIKVVAVKTPRVLRLTVNHQFQPQGLIDFMVHNHPGSNQDLERLKLFNVDG